MINSLKKYIYILAEFWALNLLGLFRYSAIILDGGVFYNTSSKYYIKKVPLPLILQSNATCQGVVMEPWNGHSEHTLTTAARTRSTWR